MSKKIRVSAPQAALQTPFAHLDSTGLPEGPVESAPPKEPSGKKRHRVVLRREKADRGGKTVVVISQLPTHLSPPEIEILSRNLRKRLGCGGAVRGREIELQGDIAPRVRDALTSDGYNVVGP